MTTELQPVVETPAPRKKGKGMLLVIAALLLVCGGGAGAYLWMARSAVAAAPSAVPLSKRGLVPFETFMVNLADGGGNRFLKVTLQLVLENQKAADEVLHTPVVLSRLRSDILELLTEQTGAELVTPEGKAALKQTIRERLGEAMENRQIVDVLFSEFVVQF
jgi:flagellar FliL protein